MEHHLCFERILCRSKLRVVFPSGRDGHGRDRQRWVGIREPSPGLTLRKENRSPGLSWLVEPRYDSACLSTGSVHTHPDVEEENAHYPVFTSDVGNAVEIAQRSFDPVGGISVDQNHLHVFDFIDVGQRIDRAGSFHCVKSLVFGKDAEDA